MAAGEAVAGLLVVFTEALVGAPGFHAGNRFNGAVRRPGFISHQRLPFAAHQLPEPPVCPERRPLQRLFHWLPEHRPHPVSDRLPVEKWLGWLGNWSGPVGSWWPGDWGSGGYYGYAYPPQAQAPAPEPQVIVIHSDGQGRMTTAEAPADYSYVKGCHAIANGYHCDTPTATP